jgi:hypothetical protein
VLLALDISTAQTGYCCGVPTGRPRFGVFTPKASLDRIQRIHFMACSVANAVKAIGADQVVAEGVNVGSYTDKKGNKGKGNLMSALALAEAHGAIKNELWRVFKIRMATLNMSNARSVLGIRKELGIEGNPKKADVLRWLRAQGYPVVNDDEADALVIWLAMVMQKTGTTISRPDLKLRS